MPTKCGGGCRLLWYSSTDAGRVLVLAIVRQRPLTIFLRPILFFPRYRLPDNHHLFPWMVRRNPCRLGQLQDTRSSAGQKRMVAGQTSSGGRGGVKTWTILSSRHTYFNTLCSIVRLCRQASATTLPARSPCCDCCYPFSKRSPTSCAFSKMRYLTNCAASN